jgi:hypothetical protein
MPGWMNRQIWIIIYYIFFSYGKIMAVLEAGSIQYKQVQNSKYTGCTFYTSTAVQIFPVKISILKIQLSTGLLKIGEILINFYIVLDRSDTSIQLDY